MPVVPRNFCFCMTPSLCKSVECGSLSLFVASPVGSLYPHCVPSQSMVVWNIIRCLMWATLYTLLTVGQPPLACHLLPASQGAEVMIGKVFLYPVYAHNQTLPTVTTVNTLAEQPTWCIWSIGPAAYQSLPFFTKVLIWAGSWPTQPLPSTTAW